MWTIMPQQQQCGAQLPTREGGRKPSGAPDEAVADRSAQDHEQAGEMGHVPEGKYPASRLQDRPGDNTPGAPEPQHPDWDALGGRKRKPEHDDLPLPEGK